jgi:hypothetical protein
MHVFTCLLLFWLWMTFWRTNYVSRVFHVRTLPFLVERLKAKDGESNKRLGHVRGFWELFRSSRKKKWDKVWNRINFASFVRPPMLILRGQWGWFLAKASAMRISTPLDTCHLGLLYHCRASSVRDALFRFECLPSFLLLGVSKRHMRVFFI